MIYRTKRFELHPFTKEDITDEYLSWFSDPEITKYNSHGLGSYIKEDAEKYLDENPDNIIYSVWVKYNSLISNDKKNHYAGSIISALGNNFAAKKIGNISLQNINSLNRSAEFACIFGEKDYWNKGYATETLKILINHGFKKMNLNRIWTGTQAPNKGMRSVAIKLGLKEEGIFREGVFLNGEYENIHVYSILKNEWEIF